MISYYEEFISPKAASAFGWFQLLIYFPALCAVVSWVAGIYTLSLLGISSTLELEILIGFLYLTFFFLINYLSYKTGGRFQNVSTIAKMIPLIGVALLGFFWNQSPPELEAGVELVERSSVGWTWLGALAPIVFSFDGWIISTTITKEVRDHQRNMPIALAVGPTIVLAAYLTFYFGMVAIVGPEYILSTGDQALSQVGNSIFGEMGERILLIFVLIAVLGVVNGLTLGFIRLPQILATKNILPASDKLVKINPKRGLSPAAAVVAFVITGFWMILHYITQNWDLLKGGDVSEIAIVFSYLAYTMLYVKVIQLYKNGTITNPFLGRVVPTLGIIGSVIILVGGLFSNPVYAPIFLLLSGAVCGLGYWYSHQKENK